MAKFNKNGKKLLPSGVWCLICVVVLFGYLGFVMGVPNMLNTIMKTAHDLLLNTVFYLMSICVITGAIGRVFVEFGVVTLLERTLRPLMRPIFNLPGVTSLGAVMTFLSDNPPSSHWQTTSASPATSRNTSLSRLPTSVRRSVWACS